MSTPSVQTVDDIRNSFPQPTLQAITGEPTYADIKKLHTALKSNAASISSSLGGGVHGLLGLTLSPGIYLIITRSEFEIPDNPGTSAVILDDLTAAQINAITRTYNTNYKIFTETTRTDSELKQQLIDAVETIYIEDLCNAHTGYTGVSTLDIITHLYNNYGHITSMELDNNMRTIKTK